MAGIDLALLPPLSVVKQLTHEQIQQEMIKVGGLSQLSPSDPACRPILAGSYRETLLRHDADEQVRAVMLATSTGAELDHIGVTYYRGSDGLPVLRLEGETDDDYRYRLHNSPSGLSTAGPKEAYEFHAMSAHPNIKGAECTSPGVAQIALYLLGRDGLPVTPEHCRLVEGYLWNRRPLTDQVVALPAELLEYSIDAVIYQARNADPASVTAQAIKTVANYANLQYRLKGRVTTSALHAALTVPGVDEVQLVGWSDVVASAIQAPICVSVNVTFGGWSEEVII